MNVDIRNLAIKGAMFNILSEHCHEEFTTLCDYLEDWYDLDQIIFDAGDLGELQAGPRLTRGELKRWVNPGPFVCDTNGSFIDSKDISATIQIVLKTDAVPTEETSEILRHLFWMKNDPIFKRVPRDSLCITITLLPDHLYFEDDQLTNVDEFECKVAYWVNEFFDHPCKTKITLRLKDHTLVIPLNI